MSKKWGILYHIGGRLRKDKGWSEKESGNPPDKFWEGEIENKLPNGFGTYAHTNGTIYVGQYVDGLREGQGTWTLYDGSRFVVFGKIIEDGKESHLMKKVRKSETIWTFYTKLE